ncbi:hypothetical protein IIA28_11000 [candidate division KSB1 bacterium]|nr:hypothetical protein [candidate division KSB1 bacterium]
MSKHESFYENLVERLNSLRKREKRLSLTQGVFTFLIALMGLGLTFVIIEAAFWFGTNPRFFLLSLAITLAAAVFVWFVGRPLFAILFRPHSPGETDLALRVGNHFEKIRDRLADALQVFQQHAKNTEGYSLELADASLAEIHNETKDLKFERVANTLPLKKAFKYSLISGAILTILLLIFPSSLTNASYRLLHPSMDFAKDLGLTFEVLPGDKEVVKGETVRLSAKVRGAEVDEIAVLTKKKEAKEYERTLLNLNERNEFAFEIENIKQDLNYYFEASKRKSSEYKISVLDLPFVRNLQVKLTYPSYSKLGTQFLKENVGDVSALKGTKVSVSLRTNKTVQEAKIKFDNESETPLRISGRDVSGRFALSRSGSYHFLLADKKGLANSDPIEYRLSVIEDQHPLVQITFPGQDVDLGKDMQLPLSIEAEDDFGFSKIRIGYRILHEGNREGKEQFLDLTLAKDVREKFFLNTIWEMSNLGLFPQDVVTYFAEVFDNDRVSGPKSSRSQTYRVRLPSIYELYDEVARSHEESFNDLQQLYEEGKTLKSKLDEIVQEMKREPELDWEEQQEVQDAVRAQENTREKLQQVQEKLDQMVDRMEQNDLLSPETLQKYQELQKLVEEMLTPELLQALQKLQQAMADLDPQKMKRAMEKFAASQEEFLKSLERTLNLLKKLQIEQKLDESIRKAQELHRRQEELNKKAASDSDRQKSSKYAQEQSGIKKDTESLEQELEQLQNSMSAFPQMPQNQIDAAREQSGQNLQNKMQKAAQQFQSGNMSGAQNTGQQISQDLQQLMESLQSAQKQLSEQEKQKIMQALRRSSRDLLNLSQRQENLMESTKGTDRNTPGMTGLADKQQDMLGGLSRVTNGLYELSQETFFVTPEIGKALGKSMKGMQDALQGLEARNPGKSMQSQNQSMSGLNEAASQIRSSMQGLSQASSAIGFQEMMQRMMGISQQQEGVNQQTSQMGQSPGEGMTMEQQAAMQRLAAEQNAVRKSLAQLLKEAGNRSDMLGDLNQVGKDMEEVVKQLQQQNFNRSIIDRQQRILSRLLDAQRSMNRRDYSRKRQAETGQQYQVMSPQSLSNSRGEKDWLRNELLKAMREGYSKDYKELIRKYFEALAREEQGGSLNN